MKIKMKNKFQYRCRKWKLQRGKKQKSIVESTLNLSNISITEIKNVKFNENIEPIDLNNGWIIASPDYTVEGKIK